MSHGTADAIYHRHRYFFPERARQAGQGGARDDDHVGAVFTDSLQAKHFQAGGVILLYRVNVLQSGVQRTNAGQSGGQAIASHAFPVPGFNSM